ncbi:F-box/LRR-repeat protein At3g59190-like [Quercus lobata]|uniref:F-box domain-containing protein n=1 Tax=Quercus lobata TaxID=97700 RepID=A0A7N2M9M8_QUELO|nr:F-box/LRR-repeat protein At3g59190-like [Quercus lobata]
MANSNSKPTGVDRISNLPDSLLCHILSFLTTKEAVVTSILSNRWKTLWTLVPKLDFDSYQFKEISYSDEEQSPNQFNRYGFTFAHIVSRVWALRNRNNAYPLKQFRLYWHSDSDPIQVETWVHAALSHELEELELHICFPELFNFPSALFNYAKTLVVLNLMGNNVYVNPPSSALLGFPSLKTLHLENVWYAKPDSFSRFLSCCPVLQDLTLHLQTYTYDVLKIIVPTLKRLHLDFHNSAYQYNKFEINTPALEYLCFSGYVIEHVLLGNLSNLVEADIEVDYDDIKDYGNMIMDFIKQLSNVKSLHLDSDLTQCLCKATKFDLPMFHNLAFLNFDVGACLWHVLPHLLHLAPNLAVIVFEKEEYMGFYVCDEEDTSIIERMFNEEVPICISTHLKTFHFKGFEGSTYELKFVGHILKMARFLKTMTVSSANIHSEEKFRVLKELLMLPRESRTCQIAFS